MAEEEPTVTAAGKPMYIQPYRPDCKARFRVFTSAGKRPKLTEEARRNLVLDYLFTSKEAESSSSKRQRLQGDRDAESNDDENDCGKFGLASVIAEHYSIPKRTVNKIIKAAREESKISAAKSPGRPSQLTPTKRKVTKEIFNKCEGRASLKVLSKKLVGKTTWMTTYKESTHQNPSASTLSRLFRRNEVIIGILRDRPFINARTLAERKAFPLVAKVWKDIYVSCVDEAYYAPRAMKGRYMIDLSLKESPFGDESGKKLTTFSVGTQAEAKIFLFGAVTKPRLVKIGDALYIDPRYDGKVALYRIRASKARKRSTVNGKAGELMFENCTINGLRYKYIMEQPGGLFDAINQYNYLSQRPPHYSTAKVFSVDLDNEQDAAGRSTRTPVPAYFTIQEDGAPGHGYDNIHDKETVIHEDLKYNASTCGFNLVKQSRHSPEINALDLGVWCVLKSAVENRADEIPIFDGTNANEVESRAWQVMKQEWESMNPLKLFLIFEQRRVLLDEIINNQGQAVNIEPHTGLRKKWKDLKYDSKFVYDTLRDNPSSVESAD